jgi:hypothetical protein
MSGTRLSEWFGGTGSLTLAVMRLLLVAWSAYFVYAGVTDWHSGLASMGWPTVPGKVVRSQVTPGRGGRAPSYKADVQYEYEVGGRQYVSSRISFGDHSRGDQRAASEALVDRYPPQRVVEVHYDPAAPEVAILETDWTGSSLVQVAMGLLLLLAVAALPRLLRSRALPPWLGGSPRTSVGRAA